ncbi:hypothetical protein NADFUDRAFT_77659 [Nadsonia fulvescens var. elongata DSM 6958]|uniref:DUF7137 domain-containing protein n=1 Tax=Nadsonia fulvescens var. elongata DSM 6958 TaxID=857566 RepID=A0A1E3PMQ2_9ASCO|nr:hypothetical protein NADFUDRAFT_77659 [Nadsonia fulvescens var. elongata DSM 6958]
MPSITPSSTDRIHSSSESSKVTSKEQSGSRTSSSGQSKSSSASFSVSIDPRLAPGGVTLLQPEPTLVDYVKSGDNVTFSWTYTSLIVTPSAINIEAYCTKNDYYYTIANNHSATDMNVIWDTSNTGSESTNDSTPLLMANYILYMYDSEKEVDKTIASAGYLAQFNSFKFGIYKPQANVSNENYNCVNCKSGALQSGRISIIGPFFAALAIALIHF